MLQSEKMDTVGHLVNYIRGYVRNRGPCTFAELISGCDINIGGEDAIFAGPNIILWEGVNKDFVRAFQRCRDDWDIHLTPCSELLYLLDGTMLDHDLVRQLPKTEYKTKRWLPVLISARR